MVLTDRIRQVHEQSHGTYGSPRIHAELVEQRCDVCVNTVAHWDETGRIIAPKPCRKFRVHTTDANHPHPVAANVLDRRFQASLPNQKWCVDITTLPTGEDSYTGSGTGSVQPKIVGWQMADHLRTELCTDALAMALQQRRPGAGLLHHSDRGSQYCCGDYQQMLLDHGIAVSMSRVN